MKVIKTNIKAETVEINPREALRNTFQDNRRTYNDNIRKYAKQMKDGKWRLNGEPIIVDDQGCCVNGYHRLSACIEAGVPQIRILYIGRYDSTIPREGVGIMTKPLRGGAISNLFIGETNWSYCLI